MRIITLLFVAACVMTVSAQAEDGQTVAVSHGHNTFVSHGHYGGDYTGATVYGCCEDDVSHCFDAWSTYCSDRKPRGACHLGLGCRGAACGCNDHCGIFQNKPCRCGPKFSFKRKHVVSDCETCEAPGCEAEGCDEGCSSDFVVQDPPAGHHESAEPATEEIPEAPIDSARYQRTPLMAPGADAVVQPPVTPKNNSSAGRWYLPYKWKK